MRAHMMLLAAAALAAAGPAAAEVDIEAMVRAMPLEAKIGQLTQLNIGMLTKAGTSELDPAKLGQAFNASYGNLVGSIINTPFSGCSCDPSDPCVKGLDPEQFTDLVKGIQEFSMRAQRDAGLEPVPVLYGLDSVHGANYVTGAPIFPHNTGCAATFDPAAAEAVGASAALWTRSAGIPWMFSPVLGIAAQPMWSRTYETFGEDPLVASVMGGAFVRGAQDTSSRLAGARNGTSVTAATAKHYFGYSRPLSGKDRSDAWIPDAYLKSYFEPSFRSAFGAGAMTTMINSGSVNGVPAHSSKRLLTDILRGELGFRGVAVTDWEDIEKLVFYHRLAANISQAVTIAFNAGVDMSMVPADYTFGPTLKALVQSGAVPEARIDESVTRVLALKKALDLFEEPVRSQRTLEAALAHAPSLGAALQPGADPGPVFGDAAASDGGSLNATRASLTLLANNASGAATAGRPVLPLTNWLVSPASAPAPAPAAASASASILVVGPASTTRRALCGGWTHHWLGACENEFSRGASIADAVTAMAKAYAPASGPGSVTVTALQGCNFTTASMAQLQQAAEAAKAADVVVLAVGEAPESESEGNENSLELSDAQKSLFDAVAAAGKPVVTLLVEPRPRILGRVADGSAALVMTYLPCYNGGQAVAELLFGRLNPSGRLSLSYPRTSGDLGTYYQKPTGDYSQGTSMPFHSPLYTFGHGLSYSDLREAAPRLSADRLAFNDTLTVSVDVTNNGPMDAWHTVLVFVRQLWRNRITPEVRMLKGFQRVFVANGATVTAIVTIPYEALSYVTPSMETIVEAAPFEAIVGTGETLTAAFNVTQGHSYGRSLRYE